jgi:hypothetical protein
LILPPYILKVCFMFIHSSTSIQLPIICTFEAPMDDM